MDVGYVGLFERAGLDQRLQRNADRLRGRLPGSPSRTRHSLPVPLVATTPQCVASPGRVSRNIPLPSWGGQGGGLPRRALQALWEPKRALGCMGIGGVSMSRRLIALLILTVTVLTACGRVQSTRPASAGYLLFLEEGYSDGGQQVTVRDSATGNIARQLPIGTAASDWSRYYTVTQLSGSARLSAIDPASGRTLAPTTIPAGYP